MSEFYDPLLYISSEKYPNMMGAEVTLKEDVDGAMLSEAVEALRERYPYFYVRSRMTENDIVLVPNPLPVTVRRTWEPVTFNTGESNYHLMAVKYEGRRLAVEISHCITDGAGFVPYIKSLLFLYLSAKTGESFDSRGFRLPGQKVPETETGNPFPGLDVDAAQPPAFQMEPIADFYRLNPENSKDNHCFRLKLPEADVMRICRENDTSPNVLFTVLLAGAIRGMDPGSDKTIRIAIGVNHKALLGNYDNYRMFASTAVTDFPKSREKDDFTKLCTIIRGQLMVQTQRENSLWYLKTLKTRFESFQPLSLEEKTGWIAEEAALPRYTATVSYTKTGDFGPLDPYIEEFYMLADPGVTDVVCEVVCFRHSFYLTFLQSFADQGLFRTFTDALMKAGIPHQVMGMEKLRQSGITWR